MNNYQQNQVQKKSKVWTLEDYQGTSSLIRKENIKDLSGLKMAYLHEMIRELIY